MRSIKKNGAPSTRSSASKPYIRGTGTLPSAPRIFITRYWRATSYSGNTWNAVAFTRATSPWRRSLPSSLQLASNSRVSLEKPVEGGPVSSESSRFSARGICPRSQSVRRRRVCSRSRFPASGIRLGPEMVELDPAEQRRFAVVAMDADERAAIDRSLGWNEGVGDVDLCGRDHLDRAADRLAALDAHREAPRDRSVEGVVLETQIELHVEHRDGGLTLQIAHGEASRVRHSRFGTLQSNRIAADGEKDPLEVPQARSPGMIPLASAAELDRLVTEAELSGRGDRLLEPRSIVRTRGAVPGGRAAAEAVCRAGRAHLEVDARGKHEAGPGTRNHASEAADLQTAVAQRLDDVPRDAKTPTVVPEPREREGFD